MLKRIAGAVVGTCLVVACTVTNGTGTDGGTGSSSGGSGSSGSGSSGSGSSSGGTTAAQAAADRATGYCAKVMTCAPELIQRLYGDQPTCVARYTADYTNALAAPSTGVTPATEEACTAAFAGWACADFVDTHNIPQACQQVMGAVATGAACGFSGQCKTGFCGIAPQTQCGACATVPAVGDSCATQGCGQGLVCTTDTKTCVVVGEQGATCGVGAPCGELFYCVGSNSTTGVTGTCQQALTQSGATCDPTSQKGPGCDHTQFLTCNAMTKMCATMTLGATGQPCGNNDVSSQTVFCSAFGTCTGATNGVPGMCVATAADGAACDTANGPGCMDISICVAGSGGGTAGTCAQANASTCM
jgi:hypothetical protein